MRSKSALDLSSAIAVEEGQQLPGPMKTTRNCRDEISSSRFPVIYPQNCNRNLACGKPLGRNASHPNIEYTHPCWGPQKTVFLRRSSKLGCYYSPYDTSDSLYIILRSSFDLPLPYLYIIISVITPKSAPSNPDLLEPIWNRSVAVMYIFFLPGHHFLLEVKFDPIDEGVQIQIGPSRPGY